MAVKLKPLDQQVIVITGVTSGIGLVTARMAAERGAKLVLAARSEDDLRQLQQEITAKGGQATTVVADIGRYEDVQAIVTAATETYGGFDTWINNAGVSIYGKMTETPVDDMRRLFDTNFWGVVYGSLEAAKALKTRGGAIINIGSVLSERAIPVQGMYSASKHAVKGFTDALRVELEYDDAPISVTLIKPSTIDTPYPEHAKNYMDHDPALPPPVYAPETVARTALHCAEHPEREVFVGAGGVGLALLDRVAPRLNDKIIEKFFIKPQIADRPARPRQDNGLDQAAGGLQERGDFQGPVMEHSLYTSAALHRRLLAATAAGTAATVAVIRRRNQNGHRNRSRTERLQELLHLKS